MGLERAQQPYFLPYLLSSLPNMKYVHVVRHGLDMASSNNTAQLMLWGPKILQPSQGVAGQTETFNYWCEVHRRFLKIQDRWPANVLLMRFEALLSETTNAAQTLAKFLKQPALNMRIQAFVEALDPPSSLGRHKNVMDFEPTEYQVQLLSALGY